MVKKIPKKKSVSDKDPFENVDASLGSGNLKNVPGIEFIVKVAEGIGGKPSRDVAEILLGRHNVNEFLIAKKLNLTINQIRNILYRLSDFGVVSFTRKKDKKKGWYTYFWTINILRSLEVAESKVLKSIQGLEKQKSSREKKRFYRCVPCQIEVSEENALLSNFSCTECGEVYTLSESNKILEEINNALKILNSELDKINNALTIERSKIDKRIVAKDKSDKRKKSEARRVKREANAAIKKAAKKVLERKTKSPSKTKKVVKKSPKKKSAPKKKVNKKISKTKKSKK